MVVSWSVNSHVDINGNILRDLETEVDVHVGVLLPSVSTIDSMNIVEVYHSVDSVDLWHLFKFVGTEDVLAHHNFITECEHCQHQQKENSLRHHYKKIIYLNG